MDYLLGLSDVDRHLNTSYSDLGLNDKTIDLLKELKFNIRLLNELISMSILRISWLIWNFT